MLNLPTDLADLHQTFGRSNRVEHGGQMYVALPSKDGECDDFEVIYNALEGAFVASTWDFPFNYLYTNTYT